MMDIPNINIPDDARKKTLLKDVVDLHVHSAPDIRERPLDDIAFAKQARDFGLRAVVIKSHVFSTAERAWLAGRIVSDIEIYGGITLNREVGGLNPSAVEAAVAMGAKLVWLPTVWSSNERSRHGHEDGIHVLGEDGKVLPALRKIMEIAAEHDIALCTGHISPEESLAVARTGREMGLTKIVVTHPEWTTVNMPIETQKRMADYGVYFERCAKNKPLENKEYVPVLAENVIAVRAVGVGSTIVSTDAGQKEYLSWLDSLSSYVEFLHESGFSQKEIDTMTRVNPAKILGLDTEDREKALPRCNSGGLGLNAGFFS